VRVVNTHIFSAEVSSAGGSFLLEVYIESTRLLLDPD